MSFFSKIFKKQETIQVSKSNALNNLFAYEYAVIALGGVVYSPSRISLSQAFVVLDNLASHSLAEGCGLKKRSEEFVKIFQEDLLSSFEYAEIMQTRIAALNERYMAQGFQVDGGFVPTDEKIPDSPAFGSLISELLKKNKTDSPLAELLVQTILATPHDVFFFPSVTEDEKKEFPLNNDAVQAVRDFIDKLNSDVLDMLSRESLPMRHLFEEEELIRYYTALSNVHTNPLESSRTLEELQPNFNAYPPFSLYKGMAERLSGNFEAARLCYQEFEKKCHPHEEHDAYSALNAMENILVLETGEEENALSLLDVMRDNFVLYNSNIIFFASLLYILLGKKEEASSILEKNNHVASQLFPAIKRLCSEGEEKEEDQVEKHSELYESWKDCTVSRLKAKAEAGDAEAQYELGDKYSDMGSIDNCLYWYNKAAEQGHLCAQASYLCFAYLHNIPTEISPERKEEIFKKLQIKYEQGDLEAGMNLAEFYRYGIVGEKQENKYEEIARKIIDNGDELAVTSYISYLESNDREVPEEYIQKLEEAARKGYSRAQSDFGQMLNHNLKDNQSREKALYWLQKAAEQGDLFAATFYGTLLFTEDDPEQKEKGVQIIMDAAISACPAAQFFLGKIILNSGNPGGVFPISQAAEQKFLFAIEHMALFNISGEYFERNIEKAKEWINIGLPLEALHDYETENPSCIDLAGLLLLHGEQPGMETWHSHLEAAAALGNQAAIKFITIEKMSPEEKIAEYSSLLTFDQLLSLANSGNADAQFYLSAKYMDGEGIEKNVAEGRKWLQKAGAQNHQEAIAILFNDCLSTNEREFDPEQAYTWAKKGADLGYSESKAHLAICLIRGMGTKQNKKLGAKTLLEAVEDGNINAMGMAAGHYMEGDLFPKDEKKAIELFTKSAEGGNYGSAYALGICYRDGIGCEKDPEQSIKWLQQAADAGHPDALMILGIYYMNGEHVEKNQPFGVQCFYKAAVAGSVNAQFSLATCFHLGEGIRKDLDAAIHWFTIAAEQGFTDAQLELGKIYSSGYNGPRDKEKAAYWMQKALAAGKK